MDYLAGRNLIVPATRVEPLGNTLVMIAPADSPLPSVQIDKGFDIAGAGRPGQAHRHRRSGARPGRHLRPEGVRSRWASGAQAEPLLARTDSVRAALALVERGEAPLGIVYATDARASTGVKVVGIFPPESYPPITYPFAIVAGRDTPAVRRFFEKITGGGRGQVYETLRLRLARPDRLEDGGMVLSPGRDRGAAAQPAHLVGRRRRQPAAGACLCPGCWRAAAFPASCWSTASSTCRWCCRRW